MDEKEGGSIDIEGRDKKKIMIKEEKKEKNEVGEKVG